MENNNLKNRSFKLLKEVNNSMEYLFPNSEYFYIKENKLYIREPKKNNTYFLAKGNKIYAALQGACAVINIIEDHK